MSDASINIKARIGLQSLALGLILLTTAVSAQEPAAIREPIPVPRVQVIPLPYAQAAIEVEGVERTRLHYGGGLKRPFLFPIIGPSGRGLTRMGHPHDPVGHSHHNSFWVGHDNLAGDSFWLDTGAGRIVHQRVVRFEDGNVQARIVTENAWIGSGDRVLLHERRGMTLQPLAGGESLILLDLQFEPAGNEPVTIGQTPFGMVGVRVAKTMGVRDGGGMIRNSEGNVGEQGDNGVFRKPARWVDYSGPTAPGIAEGLTLLDHPANPGHPTPFHVRDDGWMGVCLTLDGPITVAPGAPLRLRYGLYVHAGIPDPASLDTAWKAFGDTPIAPLPTQARDQ